MAKQKMIQLFNIWKDRGIPKEFKVKTLKSLIWSVMLYGCEACTLTQHDKNKKYAAEMWVY